MLIEDVDFLDRTLQNVKSRDGYVLFYRLPDLNKFYMEVLHENQYTLIMMEPGKCKEPMHANDKHIWPIYELCQKEVLIILVLIHSRHFYKKFSPKPLAAHGLSRILHFPSSTK